MNDTHLDPSEGALPEAASKRASSPPGRMGTRIPWVYIALVATGLVPGAVYHGRLQYKLDQIESACMHHEKNRKELAPYFELEGNFRVRRKELEKDEAVQQGFVPQTMQLLKFLESWKGRIKLQFIGVTEGKIRIKADSDHPDQVKRFLDEVDYRRDLLVQVAHQNSGSPESPSGFTLVAEFPESDGGTR